MQDLIKQELLEAQKVLDDFLRNPPAPRIELGCQETRTQHRHRDGLRFPIVLEDLIIDPAWHKDSAITVCAGTAFYRERGAEKCMDAPLLHATECIEPHRRMEVIADKTDFGNLRVGICIGVLRKSSLEGITSSIEHDEIW